MRLRVKILSGFVILAIMLAVEGAWSIYELTHAGGSAQALLDENYRSIEAGKGMVEALERQDSGVLLLLLGHWEQGRATLIGADSTFARHLAFAQGNVTLPGEQACLDTLVARYAAYKALWQRPIVDTQRQGNLDWYSGEAHLAFQRAKAAAQDLMALNDVFMYRAASDLKARSRRSIMPGLIAAASALLFAAMFNFFVHRYVVAPLTAITRAVDAFRLRQTPYEVQIETDDELATLSRSVENLCLSLHTQGGGS